MEDTMLNQSVVNLSDRDLLAVLVGENTADCMLMETGGSLLGLFPKEPCTVVMAREPGAEYGWAKPRVILSAAKELARRLLGETLVQGVNMGSPRMVKEYLTLSMGQLPYEVFMALWLDAQNGLIEAEEIFRGTLSQTPVYPREMVKRALAHNAAGVIVAHNHPSGINEPSQADRWLTDQLKTTLGLVDVKLVDHIIVAGNDHFSFCERGWL
jgi:DNA repair protein RadC